MVDIDAPSSAADLVTNTAIAAAEGSSVMPPGSNTSSNNAPQQPEDEAQRAVPRIMMEEGKPSRRRRRKKKQQQQQHHHEITWLRDTLSLSSHTDYRIKSESERGSESEFGMQSTRHSGSTALINNSCHARPQTCPVSRLSSSSVDAGVNTTVDRPPIQLQTQPVVAASSEHSGVSSVDEDDELDPTADTLASLIKDSSYEEPEMAPEAPIKWVTAPNPAAPRDTYNTSMYERARDPPLTTAPTGQSWTSNVQLGSNGDNGDVGLGQVGSPNERSVTPLRRNSNRPAPRNILAETAAAEAPSCRYRDEDAQLSSRRRERNQAHFVHGDAQRYAPEQPQRYHRHQEERSYPNLERGQEDMRRRSQPRPDPSHYNRHDRPPHPRQTDNLIPPWSPYHPPQEQWDSPRDHHRPTSSQWDHHHHQPRDIDIAPPSRRDRDLARDFTAPRLDRRSDRRDPLDRSGHSSQLDETSHSPLERSSHSRASSYQSSSRRDYRYSDPQRLHPSYPEPAPRQESGYEYDYDYHYNRQPSSSGRRNDSRVHPPVQSRRSERPAMGIPYDPNQRPGERAAMGIPYDPHQRLDREDPYYAGSRGKAETYRRSHAHAPVPPSYYPDSHNVGQQLYPSRDAVNYGDNRQHRQRPLPILEKDNCAAYDSSRMSSRPTPLRYNEASGRSRETAYYGGDQEYQRRSPTLEKASSTPYDSRMVSQPSPQPPRNTGSSGRHDNHNRDQMPVDKNVKQSSGSSKGATKPKVAPDATVMVEISPGVSVPLRRAHETMRAVAKDFYQETSCFGCSANLFCIADVSYAICPQCKVVSPVTGEHFEGRILKRYGLGLGFTCEGLFKMQSDILQDRSKYEDTKQEEIASRKQEEPSYQDRSKYEDTKLSDQKYQERPKYEDPKHFEKKYQDQQAKYEDPKYLEKKYQDQQSLKYRCEDQKHLAEKHQDWSKYGYEDPKRGEEKEHQDMPHREEHPTQHEPMYVYERRPPPRVSRP